MSEEISRLVGDVGSLRGDVGALKAQSESGTRARTKLFEKVDEMRDAVSEVAAGVKHLQVTLDAHVRDDARLEAQVQDHAGQLSDIKAAKHKLLGAGIVISAAAGYLAANAKVVAQFLGLVR